MSQQIQDQRSLPFAMVPTYLRGRVGRGAIATYTALAWRTNGRGGSCFPSLKTVAKDLGCSVSTVRRDLKELEAAEVLQIKKRSRSKSKGQTSNIYVLVDPPDAGGGVIMNRGGVHNEQGGGVIMNTHTNKNHKEEEPRRGGPAEKSSSSSPSLSAEAKPLANAFTASGADLTPKRIRILNRWAEQRKIDDVQRFAQVVQKDYDGKGRILSMSVLIDKYREAVAASASRATGSDVTDVHGQGDGAPQTVPHKTATKAHHHIRSQIDGKAKLSDHFEHVGGGDYRPATATAHAVLSSLSTNSPSR